VSQNDYWFLFVNSNGKPFLEEGRERSSVPESGHPNEGVGFKDPAFLSDHKQGPNQDQGPHHIPEKITFAFITFTALALPLNGSCFFWKCYSSQSLPMELCLYFFN